MSLKIPSRGSDQFNLRFPDGMRDKIRALADESGRSMNSQIIYMLQWAMDEMAVYANIPPDKAEMLIPGTIIRGELRKVQSILNQLLSDVEDPGSGLNAALRADIEESTGARQDPGSTPANRPIDSEEK